MISFGGKKKAQAAKQQKNENDDNSPSLSEPGRRKQMLAAKRMINAVKIGGRIRYHQEYEEASVLESLVIGYRINGISLYRQSDIQFEDEDGISRILLQTEIGQERFSRIETLQLIVPGAIGEERKLDYDSRATLGRRGQFAPKSRLVLMSTNFNTEHLKLDVVVDRNLKLTDGVHSGLQVAYLDVLMGTLSRHEPRQFTRVTVSLPVTVCKNGTDHVLPAKLLDFSEKSIRLALDYDKNTWPEFGKKDFALIGLKSSVEKPLVKIQAHCIEQRGGERIFEMTHIQRQGSMAPIEMIDVLEIKVDLMNRAELEQS